MKIASIALTFLSVGVAAKSTEDHLSPLDVLGVQLPPRALLWNRELTHTIPPIIAPKNCKYEFEHDWENGVLRDSVHCPDWCGAGQDFTLSVQSSVSDNYDTKTLIDCKLIGCTDCGDEPGDCPCPILKSFDEVCSMMCFEGSEVGTEPSPSLRSRMPSDMPSSMPSDAPSDAPSDMPSEVSDGVVGSPEDWVQFFLYLWDTAQQYLGNGN
ncbi:hypothetical protein FisN_19Lh099 [Fistulifera solaris]|uniref:Uncharacterized protein n=1 Tax=Fistulifera solaris TaxID=1519565 RepID=A0A1Z5J743_FISSO|nr:hypothetical protein FisN_19Lh099 [Fistulifera solaris]|eukprot:GAX09638.1 hypothetical protein FisN_19Lh099 [Fistulifera solaris]